MTISSYSAGPRRGRFFWTPKNKRFWWNSASVPKRVLIGNLQYERLFVIVSVFKNVNFVPLFTGGILVVLINLGGFLIGVEAYPLSTGTARWAGKHQLVIDTPFCHSQAPRLCSMTNVHWPGQSQFLAHWSFYNQRYCGSIHLWKTRLSSWNFYIFLLFWILGSRAAF